MAPKRRPTRTAQHRALLNAHRHLYAPLLVFQRGGCATCGRPPSEHRKLDMDHDHKAMVVRGLLCVRCNRALPDWLTPEILRAMAAYLECPPLAAMKEQAKHSPKPEPQWRQEYP